MINTIELFSGCGGLTDGFKQSGHFNMLAGVEWDKNAITALRKRLQKKWQYKNSEDIMIHFDIQRINELLNGFNDIEFGASKGLIDIVGKEKVTAIVGGPPCQAYSVAGRIRDDKGMHDDYRNFLFESYIKVVDHFQPEVCIFENVPGMLSAKPGGISIIERIDKAFNDSGYFITRKLKQEAVFDTSKFGVPQKRLRVIIIAIRKASFENYEAKVNEFYQTMNSYTSDKIKSVAAAIGDLPKLYPLKTQVKKISHYIEESVGKTLIADHTPRFHNARDIDIFRLLAKDIESEQFKYTHSDALKQLYTEKTGKVSAVHKYHVLRKEKPSNTIPAHLYKDGLRHIHPDSEQARTITVREAARLQTFDDDFEFSGGNGAKYKMIGNAVPPLFAKYVAEAVNKILGE
ncbi:MAG: DNA (cytosine-5-)-methyltransferase [Gammaproteobacteria bacterium]|nr:MAG: DNA (cytosine-5-)-methyltransferase [Gammaproteobacteria bacterium]